MGKPCITTCLKTQLATLSDACGGCYADTVLCAQMNCLAQCVNNPAAAACTQCQVDKGCRSAFATCSGLPTGAAPGDGGAPDAPGADGGATDTAAADTTVSSDTSTD
jgi:hypothetical protein